MSSAFAIQVPSAIYREEQRFAWWVYTLIALILGLGWSFLALKRDQLGQNGAGGQLDGGRFEFSLVVTLGIAIPGTLIIGVLKMTTEVRPTDIRVWFGWIPTYRRIFAVGDVRSVEVVTYRPILDHGGWGIRSGRDGVRVLSARGNQGVRLTLADGSKCLIGSQQPEPLARAIEDVIMARNT